MNGSGQHMRHIHIFPNLDRCEIRYAPGDGVALVWYRLTNYAAIEDEQGGWAAEVFDAIRSDLEGTALEDFLYHWPRATIDFSRISH